MIGGSQNLPDPNIIEKIKPLLTKYGLRYSEGGGKGVNNKVHTKTSWHYKKDDKGRNMAIDINAIDNKNEPEKIDAFLTEPCTHGNKPVRTS